MKLKTIKDIDIRSKTALVRVDYNVSLDKDSEISDLTRIIQTKPTIDYLHEHGAKVVLMSHFGRPRGKPDKTYSFKRILPTVSRTLNKKIRIIEDIWTKSAYRELSRTSPEEIIMLENTRFHEGETVNDSKLARTLSKWGDLFINDAFGSSHRAHASTVGVAKFLPSCAGLLLNKEISLITKALNSKNKKLCVVIGGAKTPDKIGVIDNLLDKAHSILLGGAVANTFFSTWGLSTGASLVDYEITEMARQVLWKAAQSHASLLLPEDVVVSNTTRTRKPSVITHDKVPGHLAIYDIGPKTIQNYKAKIHSSDFIIWNGPMGLFEDVLYSKGTEMILSAIADHKGTTIIGGGDTLTAINKKNVLKNITHISTGGGALLEFLEKGTLPGIEIVKQ